MVSQFIRPIHGGQGIIVIYRGDDVVQVVILCGFVGEIELIYDRVIPEELTWIIPPGDVDVVEDLIGPNIKFHHSKLNFKAPRGGEEVKWHQDIQFWPHTNYSPLTVGVFLEDVEAGMGNVGFLPGSHDGPLYDQYDADGNWVMSWGERGSDPGQFRVPHGIAADERIQATLEGHLQNASAREVAIEVCVQSIVICNMDSQPGESYSIDG